MKLLYSFGVGLLAYITLFIRAYLGPICECIEGGFQGCTDYQYLSIVPNRCHCACTSLESVIMEYLFIIIPFLAVFFILSYKEKKRR